MLFGVFAEAAKGNYDTLRTYSPRPPPEKQRQIDLFGGGAFAHYSFPIAGLGGFHAEAFIRAGKNDNKFDSIFIRQPVQYKNSNTYYGGHIGFGKAFFLNERDMLDVYAKGFYNTVDAGGIKTTVEEDIEFDKIESAVSRVGARYTRSWNDCLQTYVGGAWERGYQGRVDGVYLAKRYDFKAEELKGESGMGEIGLSVRLLETPLTVDLSAFGKGGCQEGYGGSPVG